MSGPAAYTNPFQQASAAQRIALQNTGNAIQQYSNTPNIMSGMGNYASSAEIGGLRRAGMDTVNRGVGMAGNTPNVWQGMGNYADPNQIAGFRGTGASAINQGLGLAGNTPGIHAGMGNYADPNQIRRLRGAGMGAIAQGTQMAGNMPTIDRAMGRYHNPWTQDVIDTTMADIDRQRQIAQQGNAGAAAAAGAFGGSRHGLVEAQTNEAALRQMAQTGANLRRQGFDTAAALGGQDIANRQAGINQMMSGGQAMAGQGNTMYGQALQGATQDAANRQAGINQLMSGGQTMMGQGNTMYNQALQGATTDAANRAQGINQMLTGGQTMAGQGNTMFNQAGQLAGQDVANRMGSLAGILSGAQQMGQLGGLGFGYGQQLQADSAAQGQRQQQMQQALIGQAAGMFDKYINQGTNQLKLKLGSLGVNPLNNAGTQTSTTTGSPGTMDMLGGALGLAALPFGK